MAIIPYILLPIDTPQVCVFYLVWILAFLTVNICWDIRTKRTENFHISKISDKKDLLHPAGSFCSCTLVIIHVTFQGGAPLNSEMQIPFLLAGLSGVLQSIPALCPYDYKEYLRNLSKPVIANPN